MNDLLACWVNGVPADAVPVTDRGLQYGDGVFTTIAVRDGTPLLWRRHLARLQDDTARLGITCPTPEILAREASALCATAVRATLKIMLTRVATTRGYAYASGTCRRILTLWQRTVDPSAAQAGVTARWCQHRLSRNAALAGIKHLNRLEQILARAEWGQEYAEGLMQDTEGYVVEGTMSNLFMVKRGALLTPAITACGVAGVMRAVVCERAAALNIPVHIGGFTAAHVHDADELFLTNSVIGIWPIRRLEAKEYNLGPLTRALQATIGADHDPA